MKIKYGVRSWSKGRMVFSVNMLPVIGYPY